MATARWVRYVVPVMVEIDCDDDAIRRVAGLAAWLAAGAAGGGQDGADRTLGVGLRRGA